MSSTSFQNSSLCVYIGNTSSIDDKILIKYCSQFGEILSCSIDNCPDEKRSYCDFRIIEFAMKQQLEYFLNKSIHKIGSIILDIKFYEDLLDNFEILNIDRKLFIGPILNSNNINTIVQFYKLIDPTLQYCLSRQDQQTNILIEFSNRQYIRAIIQQKTIPQTIDNQIFTIHLPIHPKELNCQKISPKNKRYQIYVKGLTDQITEKILSDYFDKRAAVVACCIISTNPKSAIIEFENEKFARKLLETRVMHLHGTKLLLSKVPDTVLSISTVENKGEYNNDEIDQLLESTVSLPSPAIRNQPILPIPPSVQQPNIHLPSSTIVTEPISIPSPDISECGWASPPRTVFLNHCPPIHRPSERLSSKPSTTMNIDINQSRVIETDTKPIKNVTNNLSKFIEQFQNEIDQIKDEYIMKFTKDRASIEHEINRLMNDERVTLDKLQRYLSQHRKRSSTKSSDNKRKHS